MDNVSEKSKEWVRHNIKDLKSIIADKEVYPAYEKPVTIFMAGSPGAGKTEFCIEFINEVGKRKPKLKIVRIDADEIRNHIPYFNGSNSDQVQGAAAIGVEKLFDHIQKNNQHLILDATFADYNKSRSNVVRSFGRGRQVGIIYLYQDPKLAWEFTKKREKLEGRTIPRDVFINSFISAKDNVNKVKSEFGSKVRLHVVLKNFENKIDKLYFNVENVDNYIKVNYNATSLSKLIK